MERISQTARDYRKGLEEDGFGKADSFANDSIEQYLNEITRIPLLSIEGEAEVGARMLIGRLSAVALSTIADGSNLSSAQKNLICEELAKDGSRRLLAHIKAEGHSMPESLGREALEIEPSKSNVIRFENVVNGYTNWLNEQIDFARRIKNPSRDLRF